MGQSRRIIWADKARSDREHILHYWRVDRKNRNYAYQLEQQFRDVAVMLATMPAIGRDSVQFPGIKRWNIEQRVIYYRATEKNLYIVRLWDTRRDPRSLRL